MTYFFDNTEEESTAVPVENEEEGADPLPVIPEVSDNKNEDVARLRKDGYRVNNDNDPSPENIPTPAAKDGKVTYYEWGSRSNICYRRSEGHVYEMPRLLKQVVLRGRRVILIIYIFFTC